MTARGSFVGTDEPSHVTVVVVTFNSRDHIGALLDSVRAEANALDISVVVADNDSADGTAAYLLEREPDVTVVATGGNRGYAAAINIASRSLGPTRAVLILNPDTIVAPGSIARMLDALATPGCGAVVPRMVDDDGALYPSLRREPTLPTALGDALLGARMRRRPGALSETVFEPRRYAHAHDVDWATGAALLVDASVARRVGPWDERYFLYSEETDYCRRIREAGFAIRYEPAAVVAHAQGASGASPELDALSAVNRIRYARKFHSRPYSAAFRAIAVVAELLRLGRKRDATALRFVGDESSWSRLPGPTPAPAFGYLVPEFPGQTHAFFWREIAELRRAGADPRLVSTRLPAATITSHSWSSEAIRSTTYLGRPGAAMTLGAAGVLARSLHGGGLDAAIRELRSEPRSSPQGTVALLLGGALLAATARREGWTHVHVHSCASSARIALVSRLLGGPGYSITLHGPLADYGPHQPAKWAGADFALVITNELLAQVAGSLGAAVPDAVSIAPMGIDLDSLEREGPYRPWTGDGEARLFSCGRLNPAKGHDTLVRAVATLRAQGIPAHLVIAGEDDAGGSGYRATLEALVAELGLAGAVELLGAVDESAVRAELERAHVFALASHAEPLGVAIMEAMGMAVPVVVGDGGGVRELVEHDRSGLLVDPESVVAVASGLRRVLDDPALAHGLGAAGRKRVVDHFGSARSARVLLDRVLESAYENEEKGVAV